MGVCSEPLHVATGQQQQTDCLTLTSEHAWFAAAEAGDVNAMATLLNLKPGLVNATVRVQVTLLCLNILPCRHGINHGCFTCRA